MVDLDVREYELMYQKNLREATGNKPKTNR